MQGYKLVLIFVIFIILFSGKLFAQKNLMYEDTFAGYAGYASKEYGISCNMPGEFIDLNKYRELWMIRENSHAGFFYGPILQTRDKKCIVMYPMSPSYTSKKNMEMGKITVMINRRLNKDTSTVEPKGGTNNTFPRSQITFELKTIIGGFNYLGKPLNDTISFNFNDYVTIIAGKKAREMFNADSIFFYNIPLEKAYLNKYTLCTGMVLSKKGRATMLFKWFFTPKGKIKKDQYIDLLSKHVWYDEDFRYDEE